MIVYDFLTSSYWLIMNTYYVSKKLDKMYKKQRLYGVSNIYYVKMMKILYISYLNYTCGDTNNYMFLIYFYIEWYIYEPNYVSDELFMW